MSDPVDVGRLYGQNVREARQAAKLTQTELGRRVGLTRSSVANIEAGRQMSSVEHAGKMAAALGVKIRELLPDGEEPRPRTRASFLSPPDFHRLNWACLPITEAFEQHPYLVGSVLTSPDYRDVDVRLILSDERVEALDGGDPRIRLLLNIALSDLIAKSANLPAPVDFQIQSRTEAAETRGGRNPMGIDRNPRP